MLSATSSTSSSFAFHLSHAPATLLPRFHRFGLLGAPVSAQQLLFPSFCSKIRPRMSVSGADLSVRASAEPLKNAEELINSVETFIFDCDGVIWKGDKLIDGVPETLDMLREKGKRLVFVTNNSTKSRKQYGKKFETLGLSVSEEEIFASSFAAAAYLKSIDFPKEKKNPGCLFIATNRDAVTHLTDAQEWAGGGSMVGALRGSTQKEPLVVGKPSTFMMDYLANKFGIQKSQICMVGDRLDTDILFGQNGGCKTLLVLSGVTSISMLQDPSNSIQPDFYTNKISDLLSLKAAVV
ncbi:unnamed protein product [Victoria cruziana]